MNIYARYFDQETVATSFEELITFLSSIPEISITSELIDYIKSYMDSPLPYPKRYKLRPRVYFILIKTDAKTLQEFKAKRQQETNPPFKQNHPLQQKEERITQLTTEQPGWYKVSLGIKRMIHIKELQKFQYQDNTIKAYIKADSPLACYNRLRAYFRTRKDIDARSQIPSPKSESFKFSYIGKNVRFTNERSLETNNTPSND